MKVTVVVQMFATPIADALREAEDRVSRYRDGGTRTLDVMFGAVNRKTDRCEVTLVVDAAYAKLGEAALAVTYAIQHRVVAEDAYAALVVSVDANAEKPRR
jgi:hypothetical protein